MSLDQRLKYEPRMGSVVTDSRRPRALVMCFAILGCATALLVAFEHALIF